MDDLSRGRVGVLVGNDGDQYLVQVLASGSGRRHGRETNVSDRVPLYDRCEDVCAFVDALSSLRQWCASCEAEGAAYIVKDPSDLTHAPCEP